MYEYTRLSVQPGDPSGVFSIRLLRVLPSADQNAGIYCQFVETQIPDVRFREPTTMQNAHIQYQALSYTWGDPVFPKMLTVVQGNAPNATPMGIIKITENLHSALQNLRKPDEVLVLWVDAVCINQGDTLERNSQVNNMPRTYAEADRVLVWLGPESFQNDGCLCLDFFTNLAALIVSTREQDNEWTDAASWRNRFNINRMVSKFLDNNGHDLIISFLTRPWFKRRWIVQEIVLAKDVTVVCGTSSIYWSAFELALTELFENNMGGFGHEHRTTMRIMSRIRLPDSGAMSKVPLDTLVEFSSFLCANPRDRLYALYGIIQYWFLGILPIHSEVGKVDYALSTEEIFTNFAILMIMLLDSVLTNNTAYNPITHLLQLAAAFKSNSKPEDLQAYEQTCENIPSWVPDWTKSLSYEPLYHSPPFQDASAGIPKRHMDILPLRNHTRLLLAAGLICDTLTATIQIDVSTLLGPVHGAKSALNDFLCAVAKSMDETGFPCGKDNNSYSPTGQHIIAALATTIVADWEHTPPNSYFNQEQRLKDDFLEKLAFSKHHLPEILHKWPAYLELVTITMQGRALFLSKSGYIGIGGADVQVGDLICILSNIRVPFILRPSGGRVTTESQGDSIDSGVPTYHRFQSEDQFKEIVSKIEVEPSAYCTFRLMGDTYVHKLMNEGKGNPFRARPVDSLEVFPIA